jgi:hypothetical protein
MRNAILAVLVALAMTPSFGQLHKATAENVMDEFHAKEWAVLGKGKLVASLLEQTVELAAAADIDIPKVDEIGKVLTVQVPIYERTLKAFRAFYDKNADVIWANATAADKDDLKELASVVNRINKAEAEIKAMGSK